MHKWNGFNGSFLITFSSLALYFKCVLMFSIWFPTVNAVGENETLNEKTKSTENESVTEGTESIADVATDGNLCSLNVYTFSALLLNF